MRKREQLKKQRVLEIEVRGLEHVREAVDSGAGVLITPNHPGHADCYCLYEAADQLQFPFYVMTAWQVFIQSAPLTRLLLRHHGCFSVDREGVDMQAFRLAVDILQSRANPLVVFPEGEVYHVNDRVTPFREGPAAMALLAARKADRPIFYVPCGIKYHYIKDPTAELLELADKLERAVFWRPRPDRTLPQRIYQLAEGLLALKEIECTGASCSGRLPERIAGLIEFILSQLEARCEIDSPDANVPERVKALRQQTIRKTRELSEQDPGRKQCFDDLDDLFLVVQLFSYPGNYVAERPTIERIAETLDKFEEDVLGYPTANVRGARKGTIAFGRPIPVAKERGQSRNASALARDMEREVQVLVDQINEHSHT